MVDTVRQTEEQKNLRSADFRYIPCDAINLGFGDNGVKLILGIEELDGSRIELVGIQMTHKTAAILASALNQVFEKYKEQTGIDITIPPLELQSR